MSGYILCLEPELTDEKRRKERSVRLELHPWEELPAFDAGEAGGRPVFGNLKYGAALEGPLAEGARIQAVYINGSSVPALLDRQSRTYLFIDYFGYVQFTVNLRMKDGTQAVLHSGLSPVFVDAKDAQAKRVCASMSLMADFVFENCEPFWREEQVPAEGVDRTPSLAPSGVKPARRQSLASQIQLLHSIIQAYEKSLPFFRTGIRHRVRPEKQWVDFERAAYLNSATFSSILQQPFRLMPSRQGVVQVPGREDGYIPAKVLATAGKVDCGIYENRYVVGFLRYLLVKLDRMSASLEKRLAEVRGERPLEGCVDTGYFIYGSMPQRLRDGQRELKTARLRISELYAAYCRLVPAEPEQVRGAPRPTAIFRSVHCYRNIYDLACRWFRFGVYDFQREDMLLPFVEGHKLYEYYVLIKLLQHLEQTEGFTLVRQETACWAKRENYKVSLSDVGRPNIFHFRRGDVEAAVFYEPRIFGRASPSNLKQLELFCSSSARFGEEEFSGSGTAHCHPDYVVKIRRGDGPVSYVILDAKFSNLGVAMDKHRPSVACKYLLSLYPKRWERGDRILGLGLIYGRPERGGREDPVVTNGYDLAGDVDIRPFIRLIGLCPETEREEERHREALAAALPLEEDEKGPEEAAPGGASAAG